MVEVNVRQQQLRFAVHMPHGKISAFTVFRFCCTMELSLRITHSMDKVPEGQDRLVGLWMLAEDLQAASF
jgi:hypothetical protein